MARASRPDHGVLLEGRRVSNGAVVAVFSADGSLDYAAIYANSLDKDDSSLGGVTPSFTLGPALSWESVS